MTICNTTEINKSCCNINKSTHLSSVRFERLVRRDPPHPLALVANLEARIHDSLSSGRRGSPRSGCATRHPRWAASPRTFVPRPSLLRRSPNSRSAHPLQESDLPAPVRLRQRLSPSPPKRHRLARGPTRKTRRTRANDPIHLSWSWAGYVRARKARGLVDHSVRSAHWSEEGSLREDQKTKHTKPQMIGARCWRMNNLAGMLGLRSAVVQRWSRER